MEHNSQDSDGIRAALRAAFRFADGAISQLNADDLNTSNEMRLTLFAFLFGSVNGAARRESLGPPEAHAVALTLFKELFEMTASESARVAQWCIEQTAADAQMNAAVHAGLEAFERWAGDATIQPWDLLPHALKQPSH